jgi:hypothetical protein
MIIYKYFVGVVILVMMAALTLLIVNYLFILIKTLFKK